MPIGEKTMPMQGIIPRILRDIDDGVLALDLRGQIIYMNSQCKRALGIEEEAVGRSYADFIVERDPAGNNDEFHQLVIDAVYQKDKTHKGIVVFTDSKGNKRFLKVTSSFLKSESADENTGVVLVISDVTETEILRQKRRQATVVFSCVVVCVSLYILLVSALEYLGLEVSTKILTQVINLMVFVVAIILYKTTDYSPSELGLKLYRPKYTFVSSAVISVGMVGVLVLLKLVLLKLTPDFFMEGAPFWNWDIGVYSWVSYIFTCVIQEFLARSMIYSSIRKMFDGKGAMLWALFLSSLLFGAVHIAHGFMYMFTSIILLGSLGGLYEKHRSIWGVTLIHYVLGQTACCLGFLA